MTMTAWERFSEGKRFEEGMAMISLQNFRSWFSRPFTSLPKTMLTLLLDEQRHQLCRHPARRPYVPAQPACMPGRAQDEALALQLPRQVRDM